MFLRTLIFFSLIVVIELYFLQAVKTFSQDFSPGRRTAVLYTAYVFAGISLLIGLVSLVYPPSEWISFFRFFASVFLILLICKLLGSSFLLIDDIIRLFRWILSFFITVKNESGETTHHISRIRFFSQLAIGFTVIPAIGFIYGIIKGAYKYRVHNVKVPSANLPEAFNGFKIVQLSDIHTGSFMGNSALEKAFDIVMKQNADLIVFTGDLVNNLSDETIGFQETFARLKAPHGVFSVLGNHDYGDYVQWDSAEDKRRNLENLKSVQEEAGWKLLLNEHVEIERSGAKIAILGVENWGGRARFAQYGKLDEAYKGSEQYPFKVLLSHDPSHWEMKVRKEYPDIDLTLSGHTHGMQMGIEIPGLKWSPVQYIYKQWAGLYKSGQQFLYVNRGLGFIGYPGRLGIWPEITVLELQKA